MVRNQCPRYDTVVIALWRFKGQYICGPGEEHLSMMSELCSLAEEGKLRAPSCTEHPLTDGSYQVALNQSMEPYIGAKQLLNMTT